MKICILGTAYPYKGGIASFNERLATELTSMGHQVRVLTFTLQYPSIFFPGKTQYSDDSAPKLTIERGINTINPLTWLKYGRKYRKHQYDLVISKFWLPVIGPALGATIRQMTKNSRTKAISIIDNIVPHEKRPGDLLFTRYFVRSVDGFVVMSHRVEADMKAFTEKQPVQYVPHPIYDNYGDIVPRDAALQALNLDTKYHYILFFGYIRKYKGLDLLMKAFGQASKKNQDLRLLVAGEYYSDAEYYEDLLDKLGIRDKVFMHTDFIANDQVKYYFCAADLVAQTYRSATQSGISQLAIHFEKPILSTDVGGLPETTIDRETGYLVPVDIDVIANTMIKHYTSGQPTFVEGIRKLKRRFSWNSFAQELVHLYDSL